MAYPRKTTDNLDALIAFANRQAVEARVNYFLRHTGRNNYEAIDLCRVDTDGSICVVDLYASGTFETCYNKVSVFLMDFDGRDPVCTFTRHQAKRMLEIGGIDFETNFFSLRYPMQLLIGSYAEITTNFINRNPVINNCRAFHHHLKNKIVLTSF